MSRVLSNARNQIVRKYNPFIHCGVDILKSKNKVANVMAHSDGEVVEVECEKKQDVLATGKAAYGNFVKIKHENGYSTLYAHLSEVFVHVGQKVCQGEILGKMGNTGNTSQTCLHFEVLNRKDRRINPTKYVDEDLPFCSEKKTFFYQVYDCKDKKWLPLVKDRESFAGVFEHPVGDISFHSNIDGISYRIFREGKWLELENHLEIGDQGIQGFQLISENVDLLYRVHFIDEGWTDWVYTFDFLEKENLRKDSWVDAIQICQVSE